MRLTWAVCLLFLLEARLAEGFHSATPALRPTLLPAADQTTLTARGQPLHLFFDSSGPEPEDDKEGSTGSDNYTGSNGNVQAEDRRRRKRFKSNLSKFAKNIVSRPIASSVAMPGAIATILKDATVGAVDMAVEEVISRARPLQDDAMEISDLVNDAFAPMEASLQEMEEALTKARGSLQVAKAQATEAIEAVEAAALAQAEGAAKAVAAVEEEATKKVMADIFDAVDISSLTYDDVGYHMSEMAPPFIAEDSCLVPGEAVARVEKAPENSRRIYAGIDIPVSVDVLWKLLTDYANLGKVVPNLTVNEVLSEFDGKPIDEIVVDSSLSDEEQCETMSKQLKGALLKQVGGAKVVGINFSARTTLEVREWPQGLPDFAHFSDDMFAGKSRDDRAVDNANSKLQRYRFPRPFAVSSLPSRDISMQSIESDDGEFRLYQGVWRMQPLPGCAPDGQDAMRLTYAVEVSPRAYLPVALVEGRIVKDVCTNLVAIRDYVTSGALLV
jgi:hypothetical protein